MKRWRAVVSYRSEEVSIIHQCDLDELEDLQEIIERGPHFDTVINILITRIPLEDPNMTVEGAEKL